MARSKFRRSPRFENLEARQVLSSMVGPTAQEQYMLQLLNEARTNPSGAIQQLTSDMTPDLEATLKYYNVDLDAVIQTIDKATPQPPLAWNSNLAAAAQGQSQYMADNQVQTHTGSGGSSSTQRIQQAGYTNAVSNNENAYAYASSVDQAMQAFLIDWGVSSNGHRDNILQPGVSAQNANRDVGIGIVNTNSGNTQFGPMVITQDFASQANEKAQLVGVAYNDNSNNGFYGVGEGQGGVQIDAVNLKTGAVASTQTWDAGGYELSLAPGQYRIIASLNDKVFKTSDITVGTTNIEQDFVLTQSWQGGSREDALAAAQDLADPPAATPTAKALPMSTQAAPIASNPVMGTIPTPSSPSTSSTTDHISATPLWTSWSA